MSIFGPFATRVGFMQKTEGFSDLIIRNTPGVDAYRLWCARSLDDAYGSFVGSGVISAGTQLLMEAPAGQLVRSPTVTTKGLGRVEESRKGQTSFQYDISDYPLLGDDDRYLFVRAQERSVPAGGWRVVAAGPNAGWPIQGPILVLPYPSFFGKGSANITLKGVAPGATGCQPGFSPILDMTVQVPPPLHITFPRPARTVRITNLSTTSPLLASFGGLGDFFLALLPGTSYGDTIATFGGSSVSEVILASGDLSIGGDAVEFNLTALVDFGG